MVASDEPKYRSSAAHNAQLLGREHRELHIPAYHNALVQFSSGNCSSYQTRLPGFGLPLFSLPVSGSAVA